MTNSQWLEFHLSVNEHKYVRWVSATLRTSECKIAGLQAKHHSKQPQSTSATQFLFQMPYCYLYALNSVLSAKC